jgi:hypothetical protein
VASILSVIIQTHLYVGTLRCTFPTPVSRRFLYSSRNRSSKSILHLNRSRKHSSFHQISTRISSVYQQLIDETTPSMLGKLFKKNKKNSAVAAASSSTQIAPKDLFRSRGDDRVQISDYNGAVMMYDEALRCESTDTNLLLSRSFARMMSTPPRLDLALQDADAVIQQSPTNWHGWLQKGETHLRMGDSQEAEEALVNAVGFAQGVDKLTAQKSLADLKSRRGQASAAASPSGPSVHSTPAIPFSEHSPQTAPHSTPTTVLSHTPSVMQTSSMTSPTRTILASAPLAPSNTQTSSAPTTPTSGKLTISTALNRLVLTGILASYCALFSSHRSALSFPACSADLFHDESGKDYLRLSPSSSKHADRR